MSFKSCFWALEDAGVSLMGVCILILILIWLLVFDTSIIQILALYLDFEGAKNIHVLYVLIWGFGGHWRFLTGVWQLDLDFDMAIGFLYNHDLNFGQISKSSDKFQLRYLLKLAQNYAVSGGGRPAGFGRVQLRLRISLQLINMFPS